MMETDSLIDQLLGRARFLRDRGEIKTPQLLEDAAIAMEPRQGRQTKICRCLSTSKRGAKASPETHISNPTETGE